MTQILTLSEVENYDARPAQAGRDEFRYLYCLSDVCGAKPRYSAHRSLCVNKNTGAFFCHRCGAKGNWAEVLDNSGVDKLKKHLAPFAVRASDEIKLDESWRLFKEGREEEAVFAAKTIENGEYREWLLEKMHGRKI